jgi:hypothetical protein
VIWIEFIQLTFDPRNETRIAGHAHTIAAASVFLDGIFSESSKMSDSESTPATRSLLKNFQRTPPAKLHSESTAWT